MASPPDASMSSSQRDEISRRPSQDSMPSMSSMSSVDHSHSAGLNGFKTSPGHQLATELAGLYAESAAAKVWKVAAERLAGDDAPTDYPEWVPHDGETPGRYNTKEVKFWTCGFFPGSLYCLLERSAKFPKYLPVPAGADRGAMHAELLRLCRAWAGPLHRMAERTNTHDLGFITQPALRQDWELTGNTDSLASVLRAARNLASRYDARMGAVRSWDQSISRRYHYTCKETNFLVIVDSMCNMDLLFYAGHHLGDSRLVDIATQHAHFVRRNLIRDDDSTWHVVNFDPRDGALKSKHTHQGYSDSSTWARGQAWTILGFTQTYIWTKDPAFLATAVRLAEHFLARLRRASHPHPYVPAWDFDAPEPENPVRDSSAGMIAANGLLLLHQVLHSSSPYLDEALRIARDTIAYCQVPDQGRLVAAPKQADEPAGVHATGVEFDAILTHATANNNEFAVVRYGDHGLVYADYYFLEFGNKLLRMGMV